MLNQLSRTGDQLPRGRHRMSSSTASVLIHPPARGEPTARELARAAEREVYAESERSGRALVSIRVEVRQPEPDARFDVLEAQVVEAQVVEAEAEPVDETEPDAAPPPMLALAGEPSSQPSAAFEGVAQLSSNAFVGYAAERALGAYAAQRAFVGTGAQPASSRRRLDVRA